MPEASQIEYKLKELAELMARDQGLTEGHWMILVRFASTAANIETAPNDISPAAISAVTTIGIQRVPAPTAISVDASQLAKQTAKATSRPSVRKAKASP